MWVASVDHEQLVMFRFDEEYQSTRAIGSEERIMLITHLD